MTSGADGLVSMDLFIDGESRPGMSGHRYERYDPATGKVVGSFALALAEDALSAIAAARRSFDGGEWAYATGATKADVLLRAADLLSARREQFAQWESTTSGAPIAQARQMIDWVHDLLRYYAGLARDVHGEASTFGRDLLAFTLREPVGVATLIAPWNFPLNQAAWKICPALAAGCSIVVKPDSQTPATTLALAALLTEAGLPHGVINVVAGEVEEIGEVLITDERVDLVSFTGSTASGRRVMELASRSLKRVSLELGGKSPNIIFPDADLEAASSAAAWGIFWRAGQVCTAGSRLFVHASVHDEVLERLVATAKGMRVGSPTREDVDLGPLISPAHLARIERYVASGLAEGATLLHGGRRLTEGELAEGAYFGPTVFTGVSPRMTIAQEEVFGPLLAVLRFETVEEAIELANGTAFGLASGVWTRDVTTALRVVRGLKAGTVWVNGWGIVNPEIPVGGWKASGFGRELGRAGLDEFLISKSVHVAT